MHLDCGMLIYESKAQGTGAGGSGCGCSAVTLAGDVYKRQSLVTAFLLPGNTGVVFCGRPDERLRLRQIQNARCV